MSNSTNRYVKAFKEAVEKLEEDNGNPSIPQAIGYDINNVEFEEDPYNKDVIDGIKALYDAADTFLSQMYYMSSRHKIKGPQKNKVVAELRTLARQIANRAYQALQLATKSPDETKYTKPKFYHKPSDLRSFFNPYEYERANGKRVDIANSDYTGDKI